MPHGVQHPNVIDVVAHDVKTDEVALIMHEAREWDGSDGRLFQLQEKINAYLAFALDGEMAGAYPAFVGKAIRLQLDCATAPDVRTLGFIDVVRRQIAYQGIKFEIRAASGKTCGCGSACET
jgi:hypothetical protein